MIVVFFLGVGTAQGRAPSADGTPLRDTLERRLVRAVGRDPALLERAARRLGLAGLLRCLKSKKRKVVAAAVRAAPLAERAWQLVPALIELVRRPGTDRRTAARAATAIRAIAEQMREPDLDQTEEMPDVGVVADDLLLLATNNNISLDIRVQSMMALAQLTDVAQLSESRLLPLLGATEPALREAATQMFAVGATASALDQLAQLVAQDPSPAVARAAAANLCASVRLRGRHPGPAVSALRKARAGSRVRELAESLDATDDQLLDLARCLRRSKDPEDRRALAQLRRRSARLRRLVRRMR